MYEYAFGSRAAAKGALPRDDNSNKIEHWVISYKRNVTCWLPVTTY